MSTIVHHLINSFDNLDSLINFIKNLTNKFAFIEYIENHNFKVVNKINQDFFYNTLNKKFSKVVNLGITRKDQFRCIYFCSI